MNANVKTIYLCYLINEKNNRVDTIYNFLREPKGREYFDTYSTHADSIKKFLDGLRYLGDERIM